jgi:hypothetical protein
MIRKEAGVVLNEILSRHVAGRNGGRQRNPSIRIADVVAEIRTENLPNTRTF